MADTYRPRHHLTLFVSKTGNTPLRPEMVILLFFSLQANIAAGIQLPPHIANMPAVQQLISEIFKPTTLVSRLLSPVQECLKPANVS